MQYSSQSEAISAKIKALKAQLTGYGLEDAITMNQIKSLQHRLDKINGVEPSCQIEEDGCISCGA